MVFITGIVFAAALLGVQPKGIAWKTSRHVRLLCPWVLFVQKQTAIRFNRPTKLA